MKLKLSILALVTGFSFCAYGESPTQSSSTIENDDEVVTHAYLGDGSTDTLFNTLAASANDNTYLYGTYATRYFSNLRTNFGNNAYGSCGYVSIGMLLAFYDAYWNDSIIPDNYDVDSTYSGGQQSGADFFLIPSDAESPGIAFEPASLVGNLETNQYLTFAQQNQNTYFQFKLFELAKECFGSMAMDSTNGFFGLTGQDTCNLLNYYLQDYRNYSETDASATIYTPDGQTGARTQTINKITNGYPVILTVRKPNTNMAHSVIAYDYDPEGDEIYVHTGWRNEITSTALTHVALQDLGYTEITSVISLDINISKNLGLKYYSETGVGNNASWLMMPNEIEITSGNYADMKPTFSWKSLYSERWETVNRPHINVSFLNSSSASVLDITGYMGVSITLTTAQWETVRFGTDGQNYTVMLTLHSDTYPYWDDFWCKATFTKPRTYQNKPYICPNEYGFADAYPTDSATKNDFISHNVRGFKFETRRYRTGYIHNEDIVMSPIRSGISEAFIEYRFETALNRIDVELSHWRESSHEWLSRSNGTAVIQQYFENGWTNVFDLLSTETNLPRNRNHKNVYKVEFSQPAYRIRFYSSYSLADGDDNNRGRICIGNMAFYESQYNLPLSGYEIDYVPNSWDSVETATNCYSYAVNAQINPTTDTLEAMQPGQTSEIKLTRANISNVSFVLTLIRGDAATLGFEFIDIAANEQCPEGMYKVALVIDNENYSGLSYAPDYDYHWYRQNSDGTWSHKPGGTAIRNTDFSNATIMDPRICDRKYSNLTNYVLFIGFYAIRPLNLLYQE